jgi:hypothetical protein
MGDTQVYRKDGKFSGTMCHAKRRSLVGDLATRNK